MQLKKYSLCKKGVQQHCNTSKNQYELATGEIPLFGLQFPEDEKIGNWISRTNIKQNKYQKLAMV